MLIKKIFIYTLFSIGLAQATSGYALAKEDHAHENHQAGGTVALKLNAGQKWHGDKSMITGMTAIQAAMASRLSQIHDDKLPAEEYRRLASTVQKQIDYMVENCRLPEQEDEQLHIVLGQILDGISAMEGDSQPRSGAVKIVQALNAYGDHFEHPNWQPLGK